MNVDRTQRFEAFRGNCGAVFDELLNVCWSLEDECRKLKARERELLENIQCENRLRRDNRPGMVERFLRRCFERERLPVTVWLEAESKGKAMGTTWLTRGEQGRIPGSLPTVYTNGARWFLEGPPDAFVLTYLSEPMCVRPTPPGLREGLTLGGLVVPCAHIWEVVRRGAP